MSETEVREALGLMSEAEWQTCEKRMSWICEMQKRSARDISHRATGRTTSMIIRALAHLSENPEEPIHITSHSMPYSYYLVGRAREYAEKLGLDPMKITARPKPFRWDRGPISATVFIDHHAMEAAV